MRQIAGMLTTSRAISSATPQCTKLVCGVIPDPFSLGFLGVKGLAWKTTPPPPLPPVIIGLQLELPLHGMAQVGK
jgi:hypothetical protein